MHNELHYGWHFEVGFPLHSKMLVFTGDLDSHKAPITEHELLELY